MKNTLFALFLLLAHFGWSQAEFKVDDPVHKFPKTNEGVLLKHEFEITNTGDAPLIISDYGVQCTCTKAELPKEPILPGKSFLLKVTFDTHGKYYFQDRTIELKTNTKKGIHKIRFKVNVISKEGE